MSWQRQKWIMKNRLANPLVASWFEPSSGLILILMNVEENNISHRIFLSVIYRRYFMATWKMMKNVLFDERGSTHLWLVIS